MLKECRLKIKLFQYEEKQYLLFTEWHNNRLEQLKSEKYLADVLGKRFRRTAKLSTYIHEPAALLSILNCEELFR